MVLPKAAVLSAGRFPSDVFIHVTIMEIKVGTWKQRGIRNNIGIDKFYRIYTPTYFISFNSYYNWDTKLIHAHNSSVYLSFYHYFLRAVVIRFSSVFTVSLIVSRLCEKFFCTISSTFSLFFKLDTICCCNNSISAIVLLNSRAEKNQCAQIQI